MSRIYKFRAKHFHTKDWVYGVPYYSSKFLRIAANNEVIIPIIPDTMGEFTGVYDNSGKEIYEGDILEDKWGIAKEVTFDDGGFMVGLYNLSCRLVTLLDLKVIGNIHDNADLLNPGSITSLDEAISSLERDIPCPQKISNSHLIFWLKNAKKYLDIKAIISEKEKIKED